MKEAKAVRTLLPRLKLYPWGIPAIVTLGILSSLPEGLRISLFIPLLQSLEQEKSQLVSGNFLVGFLNRIFTAVLPDNRLLIIALCIFGSILLKSCLSCSMKRLSKLTIGSITSYFFLVRFGCNSTTT